jgi:ketosteroid isomerase-like protein
MSRENVERFAAAVEAFNREGIEAILAIADPEIEWTMDAGWLEDQTYKGHDGLRKLSAMFVENLDDYRWDVERVIDSGDRVAALVYQRGRAKEGGVPIEGPIGVVVEFRDGAAIRVWNYFEWRSALEAVGLRE